MKRLAKLGAEMADWAYSITWWQGVAYVPCYFIGLAAYTGQMKLQGSPVGRTVTISIGAIGSTIILAWTAWVNRSRPNPPSI